MKKEDLVYIKSVNKRITLEEFKKYNYQVGKVYKINDGYFHKCVGFSSTGRPVVDTISINVKSDKSEFQIIKSIDRDNQGYYSIPSLDFVNNIMAGIVEEVNPITWDLLETTCLNFCNYIKNLTKNKIKEI